MNVSMLQTNRPFCRLPDWPPSLLAFPAPGPRIHPRAKFLASFCTAFLVASRAPRL